MKPICFMDFDGPINDNSRRLYQFMINNVPFDISKAISLEEFWMLKRLGINEVDWVKRIFGVAIDKDEWNKRKLTDIEKESYLRYDRIHQGAMGALAKISERYDIVIVTRRNNSLGVKRQIKQYNLTSLIASLFVIPQGEATKATCIRNHFEVGINDIFVGDTEDDITAGVELGIRTYFVLSGIRAKWIISKLNALDKVKIVANISEIKVNVQ